jgi:hypothetical protein
VGEASSVRDVREGSHLGSSPSPSVFWLLRRRLCRRSSPIHDEGSWWRGRSWPAKKSDE